MCVPKRNRYLVIKIEIFINKLTSPKTRFSLSPPSPRLLCVCVAGLEESVEETKTDISSWLPKHVYRPSVVVLI